MNEMHRKTTRAFTLIELALAVTLIAILTMAGIPSFRALYERTELQGQADTLASTMRYAQERAIIERIPTRMVIDVENNAFHILVPKEEERRHYQSRSRGRSRRSRASGYRRRGREEEFVIKAPHKLPNNFLFEFVYKVAADREVRRGEGEIFFYPDGSTEAVFITILRLAHKEEDERRMFIKTSAATGQIKTMEGRTQQHGSNFFEGYYDDGKYSY
ncbi:prepilin-type N-terminal cleavage/methylation domain-containing protein [bacterium]|nr:prepilin-type N-terminal cleavage/methylation domain-containing protein [bacterium]